MQSIESAVNEFKATWQEMWTKTIMSGDLKGIVNFGTSILDLINKMGGLVPVLEVIIGLMITINAQSLAISIQGLINSIPVLIANIASYASSLFGLSTSLGLVTAAEVTAGTAAAGMSLAMGVATAGISIIIATLIIGIIKIGKFKESMMDLYDSFKKSQEITASNQSELKSLADEYETLASKQEKSAEDTLRLLDIQSILVTKYGASKDGINLYTDAISGNSDAIATNVEWIKKQAEAQATIFIEQNKIRYQQASGYLSQKTGYATMSSTGGYAGKEDLTPQERMVDLAEKISEYQTKTGAGAKQMVETLTEEYNKMADQVAAAQNLKIEYEGQQHILQAMSDIPAPKAGDKAAIGDLEALSKAANDAKAEISSLADEVVGLMTAYEKSGEVSMQQVEQLKAMFPDKYTEALSIENGQIRLNTDVLKQLTIARMEEAIAKAQQVSTTLNATIQEAQANISSANTVISTTNAKIQALRFLEGAYGQAAIAAINSANNQIAASKAILTNSQAQLKTNDAGIKVMQTYLGQMKDGTYWTNAMASATSSAAGSTNKLSDAQQAYNDLLELTIKMIRQQKEDEKDSLKDQLDGYKKIIDARKKSLQLAHDEADYQDELASKNKTLSDIENELLQLQFDNSEEGKRRRLELEADRAKAVEDIDKTQADHSLETQTDALDEEYNRYKEMIDAKTKAIDEYLAHTGQVTQDAMALLSAGSESFYQALLEWNRQYGDGVDATIAKLWKMRDAQNAVASSYGGGGGSYVPKAVSSPLPSNYGGVDAPASKYDKMDALSSGISSTAATTSKIDRYDLMNAVQTHHSGGIVGGLPKIKEAEQYAKLLKGEVVANEGQMKMFVNTTLPNLIANFAGSNSIPNVEMNFNVAGNLDKTVLPELKEVILTTVYKAMKLRGNQKNANSYSL
ncbi:MAG: hypothetical protein PHX62_05295 [Bacilli bacterium]|nr:hypothetical protein [Bacilli bacterium]